MNDARPPTLLVVDDNPPTRYSTSRVLRAAGFEVEEAGTGREALEKCDGRIDLVVLDVHLPDLSGFEVCRILRTRPATTRTPVIHLSATFVKDDHKVQGLESGADGYLTHPVEPPVLVATVNAFLRARQAEDAMRASEAKFKAVFDNALNGIALFTEGMIFLDVNQAMCDTLELGCDDVVTRHVTAFLPAGSEEILASIDRGIRDAGRWQGMLPVFSASGREVYLEWNISVHSDPHTRLAVTTDLTERRAVEAERERLLGSERVARAEAERANRLKDDFLATISHELRTPLNVILGWTRLLAMQDSDGKPEFTKALAAIERNVRAQAQMIAELLDVSRITSGKLHLELQPFDPKLTLDASLTAFQDAALAKDVSLIVDADEVGTLLWDQARFQQVVFNLVDNAVKFSNRGGQVTIRLRSVPEGAEFSVTDTGWGIAPEFLPHVFDRFRQEDSSSKRRHGGLGLGLAIVKQIIEAHHGSIQVFSEGEKRGTTFVVTMPTLTAGDVAAPDEERRAGLMLDGVRILVIDDDADGRALVGRVLRDQRAEVREADSVAQAHRILGTFAADLIISDISMPIADGYDLIRSLRIPGSAFAHTPAIALTAFARAEDRARALAAGYQSHIAKPVDALKLIEAARALTRARS